MIMLDTYVGYLLQWNKQLVRAGRKERKCRGRIVKHLPVHDDAWMHRLEDAPA